MPPWRKKPRKGFFDDFFSDFEEEFRQMEENMGKIFDDAFKLSKEPGGKKPYVYGFSMRVGPDGKPRIEEFGNVRGTGPSGISEVSDEREPLTDVIEGDEEVSVIVELPGVEKKDIKLNTDGNSITIDVDTANRKYHKELDLPGEVRPETANATFKNGVLEVKLTRVKKKESENKRGFNVRID